VGERRCGPVNPRSDRAGQRRADEDAERSEKREVLVSDEVCDSGRHEERGERLALIVAEEPKDDAGAAITLGCDVM
jgi:hypothetical protein